MSRWLSGSRSRYECVYIYIIVYIYIVRYIPNRTQWKEHQNREPLLVRRARPLNILDRLLNSTRPTLHSHIDTLKFEGVPTSSIWTCPCASHGQYFASDFIFHVRRESAVGCVLVVGLQGMERCYGVSQNRTPEHTCPCFFAQT